MQRFIVAHFGIEACTGASQVGPLPLVRRPGGPQRTIRSEGVSSGFASQDVRSLALLDAIWDEDTSASVHAEPPRIVCAPVEGLRGRYIDAVGGRQLLAFQYAPFTLIKQSLRWEYGRQSPASGLMPVHGVILETLGRRVGISARGQAGKSFLADTWLEADADARALVDDWSLVDPETRCIRRTGDAALHVRGSAWQRESAQLDGAERVLVELCDGDPRSDETRYLVDRSRLARFENASAGRTLDALVLVREPRAEHFDLEDDAVAVRAAFEAEARTFWDDSLAGLPDAAVDYLHEAWSRVLAGMPIVVMRGHRGRAAEDVVQALRGALEV